MISMKHIEDVAARLAEESYTINVMADIAVEMMLKPNEPVTLSTGIKLPSNFKIKIGDTLDFAARNNIAVTIVPTIIDSYNQEVKFTLTNNGHKYIPIASDIYIAQIVIYNINKVS